MTEFEGGFNPLKEENKRLNEINERIDNFRYKTENSVKGMTNEEVDFLFEKKQTQVLLRMVGEEFLNPDQESKVLNQIIKEDPDKNKIAALYTIIGEGTYGKRLSPELVDYVANPKILADILNHGRNPSNNLGLILKEYKVNGPDPEVPEWAVMRIWNKLIEEKSPGTTDFIASSLRNQDLNKKLEKEGLDYVLNNLTVDSIKYLIWGMKQNREGIIKDNTKRILDKFSGLSDQETREMSEKWYIKKQQTGNMCDDLNFFVCNDNVTNKLAEKYDITVKSDERVATEPVVKANFGPWKYFELSGVKIVSAAVYPVERYLTEQIKNNGYYDEAEKYYRRMYGFNGKLEEHNVSNLETLISTYQDKMPDKARALLTDAMTLGIKEVTGIVSGRNVEKKKPFIKRIFGK